MSFSNQPNRVQYSCTALVGTNKKGILKPDEDGYFEVVLGALNAYNSIGAHYPLAPAKKLFDSSSDLLRRIREGNCKCELGHPKPAPGQTTREYLQRVMLIEETRVCAHIKDVWLQLDGVKDKEGRAIVAIMGKVKPAGPFGHVLKESLSNPHENVCFSIRSLTFDTMNPAGYLQKELRNIITWDVVTEPGLSACHKYNCPGLESLQETTMIPEHLNEMEDFYKRSGASMESNSIVGIRKSLGWDVKPAKVAKNHLAASW